MRRVVVTGYGAVSPCGLTAAESWRAIQEGQSGIAPIELFDAREFSTRFAGECKGFNPEHFIPKRDVRSMDRFIQLALAAAVETAASAGLREPETDGPEEQAFKRRIGTLVGVGIGGLAYLEAMSKVIREKGPSRITPYFIPGTVSNLAPGQISMRFGFQGTNYATTSACTSGAHAIGEAFRTIARGELDGCLAGGAEAAVTPLGIGGFAAMRALSKRNDAPTEASRPWDKDRDGFVCAEGAGMLFLEEYEHALKRGATIYAEVLGYGSSADAHHITSPAPEHEGAQRSMRAALRDAKLEPSQIDYLNAHGTSTPVGDALEVIAVGKVFGDHARKDRGGLWVSSTKSMSGHMLGAAGGFESVISVLALRDGIVPPTINLHEPDPEVTQFDLVPHTARERALKYVLSNSFGFGGTNGSLIFGKV